MFNMEQLGWLSLESVSFIVKTNATFSHSVSASAAVQCLFPSWSHCFCPSVCCGFIFRNIYEMKTWKMITYCKYMSLVIFEIIDIFNYLDLILETFTQAEMGWSGIGACIINISLFKLATSALKTKSFLSLYVFWLRDAHWILRLHGKITPKKAAS